MTHPNHQRRHPLCNVPRAERVASVSSRWSSAASPAVLFALALAWACLTPARPALAQGIAKHATPINNATRTAAGPMTKAQLGEIDAFINANIAYLQDTVTSGQQRAARGDLELNASGTPGTAASGAYGVAYAAALDKALLPLARNPNLSVRLNAAIVVAKVAARVGNTSLAPAGIAFTNDEKDPVSLWGVKAGKVLYPCLLDAKAVKDAAAYQAAIVNAVARFRDDPILVDEAYDDFTGDWIKPDAPAGTGPAPNGPVPPARMTAAIPAVVDLMRVRTAIYQESVNLVTAGSTASLVNPEADNRGFSFMSYSALWKAATPAEQKQMAGAGMELINQAMALMPILQGRIPGDPPDVLRSEDLAPVIVQGGTAFSVIGLISGNQAVTTAGRDLSRVGLRPPATTLQPLVTALATAVTSTGFAAPVSLPKLPTTAPAAPAPPAPPVTPSSTAATGPATVPAPVRAKP